MSFFLLEAQLYITASMWQMLRGTVIIITAVLKRFVLGKELRAHMWCGVVTIAFAMALTALPTFLDPSTQESAKDGGAQRDPRVGVALVLAGCVAQGVQYVFEEKVMHGAEKAPPLVVIGMEGLWGTALTLLLVYPAAYALPGEDSGSFENPWDSMAMIASSSQLQMLVLCFLVTVTGYNCAAVLLTAYLSSIWHAILDNFRPITVWALDLAIFYVLLPGSGFGETWTPYSYIQVGGMAVLIFGTAVYNGNVPLPAWLDGGYEPIPDEDGGAPVPRTPQDMRSPVLGQSPILRGSALREAELYAERQRAKDLLSRDSKGYNEI